MADGRHRQAQEAGKSTNVAGSSVENAWKMLQFLSLFGGLGDSAMFARTVGRADYTDRFRQRIIQSGALEPPFCAINAPFRQYAADDKGTC